MSGHCAGFVLAEPGHWAHTVAPALAALRCLRSSSSTTLWWRLSWSTSSCARPRRLLEDVLFLGFARAVRTWKNGALFLCDLVSGSFFLGVWVLHVDYGTLDSSGDDFVRGAMLGLTVYTVLATVLGFGRTTHIFNVDVDSDCGVSSSFSRRMEKYAQSVLQFESLHALFALEVWTIFLRVDVLEPA